jgi:hypothetical protein
MLTIIELQGAYREYNKKYFKGKLPKVIIKYKKLNDNVAGRTFFGYGEDWPAQEIHLSKRLSYYEKCTVQTLLHEMIHISIGGKYKHGSRFKKELKRLIKAGAFYWLL